ncbi:DUF1998 domain-containing protein [Methylobacterium soli]|uniref:DUF1998 domain-containing protein n=1 Tax=Methylobacterium soli TaxID=553447 RepID=A0A6L3SVR5_9HYPH|nr:DUF1998 domain-containing protein [Methylobacterium soli]KAB1077858.1 DUF1998 domain-containing protein [Methylobacterium soli]GJE42623.1 hypothetical protein AEGHOMDF_1795 [Methylobacterium soli]
MSKNAQRLSQLVSTFGPGSMVDLPTRSIVVGGLEQWDMRPGTFQPVSEPRLAQRLQILLQERGQLDQGQRLNLRTPPVSDGNGEPKGVAAPIFPNWFVCDQVEANAEGTPTRRRRLVQWRDLDPKGRRRFTPEGGKRTEVTPIRFVCACDKGHLQDIEWRWVVHGATPCQEPMWIEERGTSADPADTSVVCGCGKRLSLQEAFQPRRLGFCKGERPWLLDRDPNGCGDGTTPLKLLTRTATNTYFPQVLTVISLPSEEDVLTKLVDEIIGEMNKVTSIERVGLFREFNEAAAASLTRYSDAEIFDCLTRLREGATADAARSPKVAEFDLFASGRPEIGTNHPGAKLYAQTLARSDWDDGSWASLKFVQALVAVHRLREVSCLYGFTRFEAAPTAADGDIEDISLAVHGAPIARATDWLPACEQFGEGLFVHVDSDAIATWLNGAGDRHRQLVGGYNRWKIRFGAAAPKYPTTPYVLLHSLAHALMTEIALDCGYPASSLKERIYALGPNGAERCGILLYTASAGAQGTLGGLVGTAPRFAQILRAALERIIICSNDPICCDHDPEHQTGDRATHGAACHGCLLIAETSCESRNLFLDRSLLVPTMSTPRFACFEC